MTVQAKASGRTHYENESCHRMRATIASQVQHWATRVEIELSMLARGYRVVIWLGRWKWPYGRAASNLTQGC